MSTSEESETDESVHKYKLYFRRGSKEKIPESTQRRWKKRRQTDLLPQSIEAAGSSLHIPMEIIGETAKFSSPVPQSTPSFSSASELSQRDELETDIIGGTPQHLSAQSSVNSDSDSYASRSMNSLSIESTNSSESDSSEEIQVADKCLNAIVLVTALKLKNKMTDSAVIDVLKLLNCMGPDVKLPETNYRVKKVFNKATAIEIHHICPNEDCGKYIGVIQNATDLENSGQKVCDHCGHTFVVKENIKTDNAFLYVSLAEQIKHLLKSHGECLNQTDNKNPARLLDIQDGVRYKERMQQSINVNNRNQLSLSFSCDGVPVFKASGYSIWPILCVLNELTPEVRDKNVMLASLWFGLKKPNMNVYMLPFVNESKMLYDCGVNGYTVSVLVGVCDSVARPLCQNSTQFNGEYGCGLCKHPGLVVAKGRGHCRVYKYDVVNVPELRTHEEAQVQQDQALEEGRPIMGMKGPTVLSMIPNFDIVEGLIPDFLHCCLLGVARQFMSIWLDGQNRNEQYYLGQENMKVIDSCLLEIKPPCNISRTPRPLKRGDIGKPMSGIIGYFLQPSDLAKSSASKICESLGHVSCRSILSHFRPSLQK